MVIEILIKLLVYYVIITIVRIVVGKVKSAGTALENKSKDMLIINEKYVAKTLLIVAVLYSLLIIVVSTLPLNITGGTLIIVGCVVVFVNVLIYVLGLHYYLYELRFDSSGIYYRKGIHGTHQYPINQVSSFEVSNNKLIIRFVDNNRVMVTLTERNYSIINWLNKVGIHPNIQVASASYVIKAATFYIVFSFVCLCVFVALMILCFLTNTIYGGIIFAFLMFFSVIDCVKKVRNKIIVNGDDITIKCALKKTRWIKVSDIKSIRRKNVDNAEVIYIFGEKDLLFKYSKLNTNAQRFETVISKKPLKL